MDAAARKAMRKNHQANCREQREDTPLQTVRLEGGLLVEKSANLIRLQAIDRMPKPPGKTPEKQNKKNLRSVV